MGTDAREGGRGEEAPILAGLPMACEMCPGSESSLKELVSTVIPRYRR